MSWASMGEAIVGLSAVGGRRGTSGGERLGEAVVGLEDWVIVSFVSTAKCASNQPTGHFIENGRIEK